MKSRFERWRVTVRHAGHQPDGRRQRRVERHVEVADLGTLPAIVGRDAGEIIYIMIVPVPGLLSGSSRNVEKPE
ncbi:hypothetical protein NKI48_02630 [Mesorhizobium sp. M0644]|uniref:hypothetical protein n=1 Tax=Mesorhizobium sp. M0644 TaxID=2956979 RepID=UPI00333AAC81